MGDATMNYSASPSNFYQYEGKELQPELSLNTYDFGARHYDPVLGRWGVVDLLADRSAGFSSYNYVEDNPLNLTDPGGLQSAGQSTVFSDGGESPIISSGGNNLLTDAGGQASNTGSVILSSLNVLSQAGNLLNEGKSVAGALNAFKLNEIKTQTLNSFSKAQGNVNNLNAGQNPSKNAANNSVTSSLDKKGTNLFHHSYKPAPWNHDDCHCPVLDQAQILAIIIVTGGEGGFLEGAGAGGASLTSAEIGGIIGWGEGQTAEAVAQTESVTESLTENSVEGFVKKGLTKDWVNKQLTSYSKALLDPVKSGKNIIWYRERR